MGFWGMAISPRLVRSGGFGGFSLETRFVSIIFGSVFGLLPQASFAQVGPAPQHTPAASPAATYNQGQCNLAGIEIWKEGNAQFRGAVSSLSVVRPVAEANAARMPLQGRLEQLETQKIQGTRFMIIGSKMIGAFGSYSRGAAPVPNMATNAALIPVVQACMARFGAALEAAQTQRWIDFQTARDGEKSAINAASIVTVGGEVHMAVLTTNASISTLPSVGPFRSHVTHWAIKCAGPRTASARTMYFYQPGSDNIIAVQDLSTNLPAAITQPNSPIANLARVACGETRLRADAQSFPDLLAMVRHQEAAGAPIVAPNAAPKR
jgi:hypothetical protein